MNSRIKYILKAPAGVSESIIEGAYYWPDESGLIEVTTPAHLRILGLHGYTKVAEKEFLPPPSAMPLILFEEMGRTDLLEALRQRGVSYIPSSTRDVLEAQAEAWNQSRRGPRIVLDDASAPSPEGDPKRPIDCITADQLDEMGVKDIRRVLTESGIGVADDTHHSTVRKIARDAIAQRADAA